MIVLFRPGNVLFGLLTTVGSLLLFDKLLLMMFWMLKDLLELTDFNAAFCRSDPRGLDVGGVVLTSAGFTETGVIRETEGVGLGDGVCLGDGVVLVI